MYIFRSERSSTFLDSPPPLDPLRESQNCVKSVSELSSVVLQPVRRNFTFVTYEIKMMKKKKKNEAHEGQ